MIHIWCIYLQYFPFVSDFNKLRYDYSFLKSEYEHEQVRQKKHEWMQYVLILKEK